MAEGQEEAVFIVVRPFDIEDLFRAGVRFYAEQGITVKRSAHLTCAGWFNRGDGKPLILVITAMGDRSASSSIDLGGTVSDKKQTKQSQPSENYRLVSISRIKRGDWPEALKRVREEVRRSERFTEDDLKVFINT